MLSKRSSKISAKKIISHTRCGLKRKTKTIHAPTSSSELLIRLTHTRKTFGFFQIKDFFSSAFLSLSRLLTLRVQISKRVEKKKKKNEELLDFYDNFIFLFIHFSPLVWFPEYRWYFLDFMLSLNFSLQMKTTFFLCSFKF